MPMKSLRSQGAVMGTPGNEQARLAADVNWRRCTWAENRRLQALQAWNEAIAAQRAYDAERLDMLGRGEVQ